jgi:ceramide glucosyltransferase
MKTFLLFCSLIAGSSFGEILSAKGMKLIGDVSFRPRALLTSIWRMIRNPYLIGGVSCLAVSFFSFISLLSYNDLSFVVPLTAVGYITNTLGARFFLKEQVTRERWIGTFLVAGGVALITLSSRLDIWFRTYATNFSYGLRLVLLFFVIASIVYYLFAFVAGLLWFRDRRRQRALGLSYTPPVSILKPVRGADADSYENFASFCRQDYPDYQIIFGVAEENDRAVPVIKRLIADFPDLDIGLVISSHLIGLNAKVSNLQNIYTRTKHDLLLIADSDIRVGPDYLRRVIAPMQRPHVGMVTCLYRGEGAKTFSALLENIGISSTFAPDVCSARALEGVAFALGSTIVIRREMLERLGGFPAVADYLADDFLLGNRTAREGYEVVLSDSVVEHIAASDSFASMLKHQLRWGRAMRNSRPWGYRGLIFTYGTPTSLLALFAWEFASFAWLLLALTMLIRFLPVFTVGVYGLKDYALARYFWLVPFRDLISFGIWVVSLFGDEVQWRGVKFRLLPSGKLTRMIV